MMSDLSVHQLAENFLREYLIENGGTTRVSVVSTRSRVIETRQVAEEFVTQLRKTRRETETQEDTRYEIDEPKQMILSRRSSRGVLLYFCGFKRGVALFTYTKHLAQVVHVNDADKLQESLKQTGIETFVMPAPEIRRGSL